MSEYKLEIYKGTDGSFRWRRVGSNGEVKGASSEGFRTKAACESNARKAVIVGWKASEKISKVEGMSFSKGMSGMFVEFSKSGDSPEVRREKIKKAYGAHKG